MGENTDYSPPISGGEVMKALSIKQPWAWLIVHGGKDVENRTWPTNFRGRVLIHASKSMSADEYRDVLDFISTDRRLCKLLDSFPLSRDLKRGGIIGEAEVVGCVNTSISPWFCGPFGHVLANPRPLDFTPCKGQLGYFNFCGRAMGRSTPSFGW